MKNFLYPEWVLVLFAARRLGRPVKWLAERGEDFLSSAQGRDNRTKGRLALDADGRFLALEAETVANLGAYLSTSGPGSSTNSPPTAMGGVYAIPAIFMGVRGVFTNTVPIDAYRGAGKPEANYLIERLVELAARRLGIDPVELRRRNMIHEFPYRAALGTLIDCGRFAANLDAAAGGRARRFATRRAASAAHGKLRGLGIACFLETARGAPNEGAEIRFEPDGAVSLLLGTQSNGQGHETSYPQIAADLLGLADRERFALSRPTRRRCRAGNGHGGARSMHQGGFALHRAAEMVVAKGRAVAAGLLQAEAAELDFAEGRFSVPGSGRGIDLLAVARAAADPANLPDGVAPGLVRYVWNECDLITFPVGTHVAEVEIDRETGQVTLERYFAIDDYGRVINPLLTTGQVQGGVAQGIGQAMLEHTVYDAAIGPAAERLAARLRLAARRRPARSRHRARRAADRRQPARRQGLGPGRRDRRAANHHLRDPRRARPARHRAYRHAGDAGARVAGDQEQRGDLLEPGEASGAVGGEVAVFPPAPDGGQQPPDARPRRDAERGDIVAAEREDRDRPGFGQLQQLVAALPVRALPIGGEQQRQIAIAFRARAGRAPAAAPWRRRLDRAARADARPASRCASAADSRSRSAKRSRRPVSTSTSAARRKQRASSAAGKVGQRGSESRAQPVEPRRLGQDRGEHAVLAHHPKRAHRVRAAEQPHQLAPHALGRQGRQFRDRRAAGGARRRVAVAAAEPRLEAVVAQDAQHILGDPRRRVADKAHPARRQIGSPADRVEERAVGRRGRAR